MSHPHVSNEKQLNMKVQLSQSRKAPVFMCFSKFPSVMSEPQKPSSVPLALLANLLLFMSCSVNPNRLYTPTQPQIREQL